MGAKYTADFLIAERKRRWEEAADIEFDKVFREAVADELIENREMLEDVQNFPEKLIELLFIVVDKNQRTMPFFLNDVQKDFVTRINKAKSDFSAGLIDEISLLVLKGRQQGFTSFVTAYQLANSILKRNFQGYTLADESDNAEAIFQNKAKFVYSQLPDEVKPTEKYNNRRQLLFEKINSSWEVDVATKEVGRSKTINFFHGSECAFWKAGISTIQAAMGQAFTTNCIKIYESTANGYNDYRKMWESKVHINCFYEWWKTKEYATAFRSEEQREAFLSDVSSKSGWIYERCRWLQQAKGLSDEQIHWYFNKWQGLIDKDLIKQEYPCTPDEAFLMSGRTAFDTEAITKRLADINEPIKVGYFKYEYNGLKIFNVQFVESESGCIKIYREPSANMKFCIGGDTAGEGSDFFVGQVLDAKSGEQVAVLRHQFDMDQYARQMYCLGKYYGDALIGIEANFDTYPIKELQRLGYRQQYVRESVDSYTNRHEKKYGFKTTKATRSPIISRLKEIVRDSCELINDRETLEELLTIVVNADGRTEAAVGYHDDMMMALAIAYQIREQVVIPAQRLENRPIYNFSSERPRKAERGEKVTIV